MVEMAEGRGDDMFGCVFDCCCGYGHACLYGEAEDMLIIF